MSSKIIPVGFDNITILRGSKYVGLWEWDNCDFEGRTATIKIKNIHPDFKDKKNAWEVGTARVEPLDIDGNPYKGRVEIELTKEETFLLSIPEEEEFLYDEEGGYYSVLNIILDDGTVILSANVKVINSLEVETLDYFVDEKDKAAIINEKLDTIIANNADFVSQRDIHLKTLEEAQVNIDTQTKDITIKHEEINKIKEDVISLKDEVETIFDNFDDRYLGVFDTAPILDNDGEALEVGAIYFDKIDKELKFYNGDSWDSPVGAAQTYARQASQSASDADTSKLATKQIEDNVKLIEEAINKKSNSILDLVVESNTLNDSESATVNYDSQTGVMTFGIPKGKPFTYADFTKEQLDNLQGKDGLSAYEIAVKNGLNGTEQEWLDSFGLSNDLKSEIESVKVSNVSIDAISKELVINYTDNKSKKLSIDDIISQSEINKKIQIGVIQSTDTNSSYTQLYGTNSIHNETIQYNQHDVFNDNSCYATYKFNGDANDLSGLYNGVASNISYVTSSHGQGASFNGTNSKIDITNIILPDTITATFYLKINSFKDQMFLDFGDGRCIFMYSSFDKRLRAQYANVNNANTSSTNVLELGVTYFVVATITKTSVTLNLDKATQTKTAWSNYINSRGKSIGYRNDNSLYANCTIDQLKLFNRVLTAEEINFLYTNTVDSYTVSKIQIDNGIFMYAKGMSGEVYIKEFQEFTGEVEINSLSDGWKYVAKDENNVFSFHTEKPTIGRNGTSIYFLNGCLYNKDDVLISPAISFLKDKIRISNGSIVEMVDAEIPRTISPAKSDYIISPNGTKYKIIVDNNGVLSTTLL